MAFTSSGFNFGLFFRGTKSSSSSTGPGTGTGTLIFLFPLFFLSRPQPEEEPWRHHTADLILYTYTCE